MRDLGWSAATVVTDPAHAARAQATASAYGIDAHLLLTDDGPGTAMTSEYVGRETLALLRYYAVTRWQIPTSSGTDLGGDLGGDPPAPPLLAGEPVGGDPHHPERVHDHDQRPHERARQRLVGKRGEAEGPLDVEGRVEDNREK